MSGSVAINPTTGEILTLSSDGAWAPAQRARNPQTGAEVYHNGTDWQPVPARSTPRERTAREANSGVGGYIDSMGRQFAQGATFGVADELSAGLRTGAGLWGNYSETLAGERARDDTFRNDNPISAGVANFAGAVMGPGRNLGVMGPAQNIGASLAQRLLRSSAGRGIAAGVTGGALAGAGEGEGIEGRAAAAATGGALGGAFGGVVGAGVSAAAPLAGRLLDYTGLRNAGVAADRHVARAFERDGVDIANLQAPPSGVALPRQTDTGIVDMGGRNVVNLGAVAANTPGEAVQAADAFVQGRRAGRPERVAGAVDDAFGGGGGTRVMDEAATLRQTRATNAAPLYDEAFSRPTGMTEPLRVQVDDPIAQAGLRRGLEIQRIEAATQGRRADDTLGMDRSIQYNDGGDPVIVGTPSTRTLDAIKRGLDDILEGYRDPTSGRLNLDERGRTIDAFRRQYVARLDDGNPTYADARAAWSGPSQSLDAMAQGQSALRVNPDVVSGIAARLSPADQEFFRLGVGRAITDAASDPQKAPGVARRLLEDRNMQRRLEAAIPDPAQRAQFAAAMQREVSMASVDGAVSPRAGSQTGRLAAGGDDMQRDPPGGFLAALLMGRPMEAARQGVSGIYRATQGINSKTSDALASRLFSTDGTANAETLRRLLERRTMDQLTARDRAGLAGRLLSGTAATASMELNDR